MSPIDKLHIFKELFDEDYSRYRNLLAKYAGGRELQSDEKDELGRYFTKIFIAINEEKIKREDLPPKRLEILERLVHKFRSSVPPERDQEKTITISTDYANSV